MNVNGEGLGDVRWVGLERGRDSQGLCSFKIIL